MKISELIKILKKAGCYCDDFGGCHDSWYSPITKKHFYLPRHGAKEIGTGLLHTIYKQSGIKH